MSDRLPSLPMHVTLLMYLQIFSVVYVGVKIKQNNTDLIQAARLSESLVVVSAVPWWDAHTAECVPTLLGTQRELRLDIPCELQSWLSDQSNILSVLICCYFPEIFKGWILQHSYSGVRVASWWIQPLTWWHPDKCSPKLCVIKCYGTDLTYTSKTGKWKWSQLPKLLSWFSSLASFLCFSQNRR